MKESFVKLAQSLILTLAVAAAIVSPLLFLPTTTEFFEFNKYNAYILITIIGFVIWAIKMVIEKRTVFTRTPLDIPIVVFGGVLLFSALSSIDQFVSINGGNGKVWPAFLPFIVLALFYFLVSSNLKSRKQINLIIWALVGATAIASLFAISSYFGAFLPFDFAQIRSFNTVGVINKLALLQVLILPIAISWAIYEKDQATRIIATACTLIMAFSFVLINFLPAYLGLAVAIVFLGVGTLKVKLTKTQQGHAAILAVVFVLFLVIRFVPQVAKGTLYQWIIKKDAGVTEAQQIDTPKERIIPGQAAWDISAQSIGKRPLFGTGVGTYPYVYTQLKPREINATDDWSVRFANSSSEFTEIVATTGILGTLAFLLLLVAVLRLVWTLVFKSQNTIVYLPLASSALGFIVLTFIATSSFAITSVFFLVLACLAILAKAYNEDHVFDVTVELATLKNRFSWLQIGTPGSDPLIKTEATAKGAKSQLLPAIFALAVVALSLLIANQQTNAYRAEYFFRQSLLASRSNDGNRVVQFEQKALQINPAIDTYHRALSQTALNAAINLSQQKNLSDEQKQLLGQLAQVAIDQGKAASGYQILPLRLPGISAPSVANWETLSSAYQALIGSVQGADTHAANTLAQAVALDPQNPILHTRLGNLYERLGNIDLAQRKYEDAKIVKNDYGPAYYSLANILISKKGDVLTIVQNLTLAKRFLPASDPASDDITKKLDDYNKQLAELQKQQQEKVAGASTNPNASPTPGTSPSPSPSTSPSPSPKESPSPSPTL